MIELSEKLIPMSWAARLLGKLRDGAHVHPKTVCRWCRVGILLPSGERLRLDSAIIGRSFVTSERALKEFMAAMTRAKLGGNAAVVAPSPEVRARQSSAATAEVRRLIGTKAGKGKRAASSAAA